MGNTLALIRQECAEPGEIIEPINPSLKRKFNNSFETLVEEEARKQVKAYILKVDAHIKETEARAVKAEIKASNAEARVEAIKKYIANI